VCDKKLASEFDPFDEQRYYRELTYSILDGSGEKTTVGGTGEGEVTVVAKVMPVNARSPRVDVWRRLHFVAGTRIMLWVVSFSLKRRFGPRRGRRGVSRVDGVLTRQRRRDAVDAAARASTDRFR